MTPDQFLDTLMDLPQLYGGQVSPDGRWVAWSWSGLAQAADVYVAPANGAGPAIRLTDTAEDTSVVSWTPDSRGLVVEEDKGGDERVRLFRLDLTRPLEMRPLTEEAPGYFIRGGRLHPNGRWLIYAANADFAAGKEIEPFIVYRHDLQSGERLALTRPERGCSFNPRLNDQGTHILYTRNDRHPAGRQVWLVDIEGHEDREILSAGDSAKTSASWLPDGEGAVVVGEAGEHERIGLWGLTDGTTRWLIDDPARAVEHAFAPRGSTRIVVEEIVQARSRASFLDPKTGRERKLEMKGATLLPRAPAGDFWVGAFYSATRPLDLVRFDAQTLEEPKSLTGMWRRTSLTQSDLTPAEDFRWRAPDGLAIQGWLYRARGRARGTIVYVHGGPTAHSQDRVNAQIQYFVRCGFNVLDPNYRGSTGFGLAFRESIKREGWGGMEQEDIRSGIEALIEAGIAEKGKVGITGTSYGGYSSWCAITRWPRDIVAAAAPICGMTDLVVDYETTRPDIRPYSEEMMGGSPSQNPSRYRERSPLNFVGNIEGRLLIVQGARDPNVTVQNLRVVEAALKSAGKRYEVLLFEDEGHGISRKANRKRLFQTLAQFFGAAFEG